MGVNSLAEEAITLLRDRGLTVGTGESLTAGLVCSALAEVPGCSDVLRGGVVAYEADVKRALLDVSDAALVQGVVSEAVAIAMAHGARAALGADVGVATTGVAGPDAHDGSPVGRVWIAVVVPAAGASPGDASPGLRSTARRLDLDGDRAAIRAGAVQAALGLLRATLDSSIGAAAAPGE